MKYLRKLRKDDYKTEYYLNFPNTKTRKLICKFRVSDHPLAIETGRYKNIPRNLRLCSVCNLIDDEIHFFLKCKINENIRTNFIDTFNLENEDDETIKLRKLLNPDSIQQVISLSSYIKQSLELRTGGT